MLFELRLLRRHLQPGHADLSGRWWLLRHGALIAALAGAACGSPHLGDAGVDAGPCLADAACPLQNGQDLYIDGIAGSDGPCCCGSEGRPCLTITRTVELLQDAGVLGARLHAYNSDQSHLWVAPEEWPIMLSMGVTLQAPGIDVTPPADNTSTAFRLQKGGGADDGGITIEGDPDGGPPLTVGVDHGPNPQPQMGIDDSTDNSGLYGRDLRVSNVWLAAVTGLQVGAVTVVLGPSHVWIGSRQGLLDGGTGTVGIYCPDTGGLVGNIYDEGDHTVQIDTNGIDLSVGDGCSASLTHGPSFGRRPVDGGCPEVVNESQGPGKSGIGSMEIGSAEQPAEISCMYKSGLGFGGFTAGREPRVSFTGSITDTRCWGIYGDLGELLVDGAQIHNAGTAVALFNQASVRFASDAGLPNDLSCNGLMPIPGGCFSGFYPTESPLGGGIASSSQGTVVAEGVLWSHWDPVAGIPQTWTCANDFISTDCTCAGPDCPPGDGGPYQQPPTMDVATAAGATIDTAHGALSPRTCP